MKAISKAIVIERTEHHIPGPVKSDPRPKLKRSFFWMLGFGSLSVTVLLFFKQMPTSVIGGIFWVLAGTAGIWALALLVACISYIGEIFPEAKWMAFSVALALSFLAYWMRESKFSFEILTAAVFLYLPTIVLLWPLIPGADRPAWEARTIPAVRLRLKVKRLATSPGAEDLGPYWFMELIDGTRFAYWGQALIDVEGAAKIPEDDEDGAPVCKDCVEFVFGAEDGNCYDAKTWGKTLKDVEVMDEPKKTWAFELKLMKVHEQGDLNMTFWKAPKKSRSLFDEVLETGKQVVHKGILT